MFYEVNSETQKKNFNKMFEFITRSVTSFRVTPFCNSRIPNLIKTDLLRIYCGLPPAGFKMFYILTHPAFNCSNSNRNTRTICEICSKLTMKTLERRQLRRSGVFIVHFEQISPIVLMFLSLTLNKKMSVGYDFLRNPSATCKL